MKNTLQLMDERKATRPRAARLRCLQTGETATVLEWAREISKVRKVEVASVKVSLYRTIDECRASGKPAKCYGVAWECV